MFETSEFDQALEEERRQAFIRRGAQIANELRNSEAVKALREFLAAGKKVATERLCEVDATKGDEVRYLQYQAWRADAFEALLKNIIETADRFAKTDEMVREEVSPDA